MSNAKVDELDWLQVREELDSAYVQETILERTKRKSRENPFVPIGCIGTAAALTYGLYNFYRGNRQMQQYMMRTRVAAQAFTIFAMVAGFILIGPKSK
ncbi:hypothetical protein DMN91_007075 [Ooceraea biroi]|uniref:HIG1 domain family member 2A n=1 Tax=Ooceraea biroi TaxID=2015173 RepID=A0A026WN42_OOCBI|nr:HIG1 domain family member 2A, mitochondrial [Ooceraea biroi]EZA57061.1 HIG1 domain family member 2A [Ooceraea biroi]RLU20465.1 hypothetical protein DMN91_007075 [Ooceraea biroi]